MTDHVNPTPSPAAPVGLPEAEEEEARYIWKRLNWVVGMNADQQITATTVIREVLEELKAKATPVRQVEEWLWNPRQFYVVPTADDKRHGWFIGDMLPDLDSDGVGNGLTFQWCEAICDAHNSSLQVPEKQQQDLGEKETDVNAVHPRKAATKANS